MSERTNGLRRFLSSPWVYRVYQSLVCRSDMWSQMVHHHVCPWPGAAILDIGCGPGNILSLLPQVDYVGLDRNPAYIAEARRRFGDRGIFLEQDVTDLPKAERSFDLIMAFGLLHHVDDDGARSVMAAAGERLKSGGRLVTLDPVFVDGQSFAARWMAANDRGRFVRRSGQYRSLAEPVFASVEAKLRHDLLRIPFSGIIMVCSQPRSLPPADHVDSVGHSAV